MALRPLADGWLLIDYDNQRMERHDAQGRLIAIHAFSGAQVRIEHAGEGGTASRIIWPGGRHVVLQRGPSGLETLIQPDGQRVSLAYTTPAGVPDILAAPLLSTIRFQDGHSRQFGWQVADAVVRSAQTLHASSVRLDEVASLTTKP